MAHRVTETPPRTAVELDATGAVLVKRAVHRSDRLELRREVDALQGLAFPTGLRLVDHHAVADGVDELRLGWVGAHSLATTAALPPGHAAAVVATLAGTVAELHEQGWAHRRITADHVVLDGQGRPVLCGYRLAGPAGPPERAADVAALGRLLVETLGDQPAEAEPIPDRRLSWRPRRWHGYGRRALLLLADQACADRQESRPTARAFSQSVLACVPSADRAAAGDDAPRRRLALGATRTWAAAVRRRGSAHPPAEPRARLLPPPAQRADPGVTGLPAPTVHQTALRRTASLPGRDDRDDRPPSTGRDQLRRRASRRSVPAGQRLAGLGVVLGVLLVLGGLAQMRPARSASLARGRGAAIAPSPPANGRGGADAPPSSPATTAPRPSRTVPSTRPHAAAGGAAVADAPVVRVRTCPTALGPATDVDGDGCPEPVIQADGRLRVDGVDYRIGRPGDRLVVARWGCGRATPAVLRPSTGDVFVFGGWATAGRALTVRPTLRVAGATGLRAADRNGDGCPELVVDRVTGEPVTVRSGRR